MREVGQRPARFLLTEARRKGVHTAQGLSLHLTLSNLQIAARIGTVRKVVSRALTRLQHDGLIVIADRVLTIPDKQALAAFAGEW